MLRGSHEGELEMKQHQDKNKAASIREPLLEHRQDFTQAHMFFTFHSGQNGYKPK